jgi:hypothetical protein
MTTFNTGNPIGSTDARDRSDNSENLDLAVNSLSQTFVDRLGVTRDTLEGIYQKSAYYRAGTFDAGYTLTNNRQTLAYGNIEYSWSGAFPKVVSAGSTPTTSGGISAGAWVDRTDNRLRSDLNIVVKTFESVISMKNDMTLIPGMIVETLSYRGGLAATINNPTGGNKYEIVAANTGSDDGGLFINLPASGLQAKGLFENGIYNVNQWGCYNDGINVDTPFLLNAIASNKPLSWNGGDYIIDATLTGSASWCGAGSGLAYSSDSSSKWTTIRLSGANSGVAFLNPPSHFTGFHIDGQNQLGVGLALGLIGFLVWGWFWVGLFK